MESAVQIIRIGILERGKSEIETRDRKSGNRFLSKTNENLRNRQKVTHEKNYFQKDDQDGIQVQGMLFSKLT